MGPPAERLRVIGDAAIRVLARDGGRGLTHRAVDRAAGLPVGSTSYYASTREALLSLALARIAELDQPTGAPEPIPEVHRADLAGMLAAMVLAMITDGRDRALARYELSLEATRRPVLRDRLEAAGRMFRDAAHTMLTAMGSPAPGRHARLLVAVCDGIIFDALVGAGTAHPPTAEDLHRTFTELLDGLLGPDPASGPRG